MISNIRNLLFVLLGLVLPFSGFASSTTQFVLFPNILVISLFILVISEGEFRRKITRIKSSKWMVSLSLLLILYYLSFFIYGQFSDTIWILKRVSILWILPILYSVPFQIKTIYKSLFAFLFSMFLSSVIAILENIELININGENWNWAAFLKYTDHNLFLASSIVISIYLIFKVEFHKKYKNIIFFFLPFYLFSIFTEAGKSGQIVLILLLVLFFIFFFKNNIKKLIISVITLIIAVFVIYNTSEIVEKRFTYEIKRFIENKTSSRSLLFNHSIDLIKENPVLGYGAGIFTDKFGEINEETKKVLRYQHKTPHNNYLYVWIELGLLGLLLFLLIFYFQIKELYYQNDGDFMILLPIMYLCVMMTDTYLFNQNTLILYVFLSVIVVNYQYKLS